MFTEKMRRAIRRDTKDKHNVVTDLLDEIERLENIIKGFVNTEQKQVEYTRADDMGEFMIVRKDGE